MHRLSVLKSDVSSKRGWSEGYGFIPGASHVQLPIEGADRDYWFRVLGEGPLTLSLDPEPVVELVRNYRTLGY